MEFEAEPSDLATKVFLFQAVRELILNAVKHAEASSLRVFLSCADANRLRLVVEDNGRGFEPTDLNRTGEVEGFGLFSIRERLDVMGGRLDVTQVIGGGTKVTILVPRYRPVQG